VTRDSGPTPDDLACIEVVELLSAYLDGQLDHELRRRVDDHLAGCDGCTAALGQFETVKRLAGRLTAAEVTSLDPLVRDRLMTMLRLQRRK
jgi:anti-sigma factor RsiW